MLTFARLREVNVDRALAWHGTLEAWSTAEWGNALAGEVGELCNVLKKLLRHDKGNVQAHRKDDLTREELVQMAAEEIADVMLYLDLVAARLGVEISEPLIKKFNSTSEENSFPHRL